MTRDRLVQAAVTLFQRRYHGTGISEILAHAGVPKGSLYHHFQTARESLGIAALEWLMTVEMETHFDRCAVRQRSVPAART
ncbi:MAG: TetR/AcrR family transcriptional regulator [Rhizobiaceae bacterium]|nr:TetR/AcrR family transcriptional regulator [Rhizobiaceae bacterium]